MGDFRGSRSPSSEPSLPTEEWNYYTRFMKGLWDNRQNYF